MSISEIEGSVEVIIRIQPPEAKHITIVDSNTLCCLTKTYNFDYIFPFETRQSDVFDKVGLKVLSNARKGYNSCIFVYGQTGSGKTYTMTGTLNEPGLVQRSVDRLWNVLEQFYSFEVRLSYFQIYNQQVNDLLSEKGKKKQIKMKQSLTLGFYLQNLGETKVENKEDILSCLEKGIRNRSTAETKMNQESSRSHSILTLNINTREIRGVGPGSQTCASDQMYSIKSCKIHFVDLAGSEKQKSTETAGDRLREASSINKSLTSLSIVIEKLSNKSTHIPYRNSVLTKILRDSLGGNSKTILIATLSSKESAISETISTINFATKAKKVKLSARVNEEYEGSVANMRKMIEQLEQEIKMFKQSSDNHSDIGCQKCIIYKREYEKLQSKYNQLEDIAKNWEAKFNHLSNILSDNPSSESEDGDRLTAERFTNQNDILNQGQNNPFIGNQESANQSDLPTIEQASCSMSTIYEEQTVENKSITQRHTLSLHSRPMSCSAVSQLISSSILKIKLIELTKELEIKSLALENLEQVSDLRIKTDQEKYQPIMELFKENMKRMRFSDSQKDIFQAQYVKIKQLHMRMELNEENYLERYQKCIQANKRVENEMLSLKEKLVGQQKSQGSLMDIENNTPLLDGQGLPSSEFRKSNQTDVVLQLKGKVSELSEKVERLEFQKLQMSTNAENLQISNRQYIQQNEEKDDLIQFWQGRYETVKRQLQQVNEQNARMAQKLTSISQTSEEKNTLQEIKVEYRNSLVAKNQEISKLQCVLRKLKVQEETCLNDIKIVQQEKENLSEQLQSVHNQLLKQRQNRMQLQATLERLRQNSSYLVLEGKKKEKECNRAHQNLTITTDQFNQILRDKNRELQDKESEITFYFTKTEELEHRLKFKSIRLEEMSEHMTEVECKLKRVEKKYQSLKQFVNCDQTNSLQNLRKKEEENTKLKSQLGREKQRVEYLKSEYSRKEQEINDLRKECQKHREWSESYEKLQKSLIKEKNEKRLSGELKTSKREHNNYHSTQKQQTQKSHEILISIAYLLDINPADPQYHQKIWKKIEQIDWQSQCPEKQTASFFNNHKYN